MIVRQRGTPFARVTPDVLFFLALFLKRSREDQIVNIIDICTYQVDNKS